MIDIVVPTLGESVTEATVARWAKQVGEAVAQDELLVELETDKVAVEVPSPMAGVLSEIAAPEEATVEIGALLGRVDENQAAATAAPAAAAAPTPAPAPAAAPAAVQATAPAATAAPLSPAVRRLVQEHGLDPAAIPASGKDGRLLKDDVLNYIKSGGPAAPAPAATPAPAAEPAAPPAQIVPAASIAPVTAEHVPAGARTNAALEEVVRMTRLRKTIARRLKDAQNTAAMLTTFNEVDMGEVMAARSKYRDQFEKRHGSRLGFMSFFVRAAIQALKDVPAVNAEIDGDNLVYKNYYNVGVAVGTPQGLVVPVLRDADTMSFATIEEKINDFGRRARDGKLTIDEMQGGTFTISNGGVYGSLLSMPILNPPQSGILGMHKIQERPMVVAGEVVARPMMYLALSYDHRIIDGREAVTFLVRMKECIEEPDRLLFEI
ncbi:MAG: 2-oxoglutarate dehydrogenase complex dihydrolipoyllysine-residue succinyltransferase [Alphaproteobacteria bacterium]|jgi:2-oxoglutarate dehydrogenase E2 component (dihydrolipoamide succinyltransferase)|nr:2-oxoglutarate dehydrogenase complex dihydrolipoyllysine-residue succinyltransferase [Alphaproteobacteria bacterium]